MLGKFKKLISLVFTAVLLSSISNTTFAIDKLHFVIGGGAGGGWDGTARGTGEALTKSGMLKSGTSEFDKPMTFTWDMMDARSPALTGAINPAEFKFHQDGGQISITFHGFIFSSSVPGEVTLPIHTSRPVAAFA